jgi:hypothetical protein
LPEYFGALAKQKNPRKQLRGFFSFAHPKRERMGRLGGDLWREATDEPTGLRVCSRAHANEKLNA